MFKYFKYIFTSKIIFSSPRSSKVLFYNGAGAIALSKLLQPWNPEILYIEGEELNLVVLWRSLFTKGSISDAYEDCYIKSVNPSVIITYIDNSFRFYSISNRHSGIKTMFIQNGWRGGVADTMNSIVNDFSLNAEFGKVDLMCTYGEVMGEWYSKYLSGEYFSVGSILNNQFPIARKEKKRRIAFVSNLNSKNHILSEATECVLQNLKLYSKRQSIPLAIVGRSDENSEKNYYFDMLGADVEFISKRDLSSSYEYLDESEVSVSIDTSLGYETVSRGNKNAFFSILGYFTNSDGHNFGWPAIYIDKGAFWTNYPDPKEFFRILDYLFEVTQEEWEKEIKKTNFSSLITYDQDNTIVKSIIEDAILE